MARRAVWTYTLRQCEGDEATKLYCFQLTVGDVSWSVLKSIQDLKYLRQTLATMYHNEVLNANAEAHWTLELKKLLQLRKMERAMTTLLCFYEDAMADTTQPSFLLHVLKGLLRVFLGMPCHPERYSIRASSMACPVLAAPKILA
ncbi:hypothetical protein SPRG_12131 [Saprolegnia parasitica CBS 223.65]|uniref:Uncharacterized protein n=1 Tax=Saprolegnia parasitica (strain CBS 223.65) TaxID=695850 RepID=A0A067C6X8_SAPPC|nr:hypothetical protein SPRG_12131 [Saprolegnia parasitica CBS 223.65]KDO22291.1 hypothetical protein SPRG_12131 [Saprolegnia parasitica CBS 223.65]|eukprot:XP_012207025.1 hypothetical protein SPRG_12131 [Saprolegnia parasitica CBS 223.65]